MHTEINLTHIALTVLTTLGCGLLFERLKQPAVLGYIIAGVVLSFFDLAGDRNVISMLAELGVIMLLYLIGLELSLRAFKSIWLVSLGVTVAQIAISCLVVAGIGQVFGLSLSMLVTLAFSVALSSTAVAIKMMQSIGEFRTETGRLAVGVLIAQDLAFVPLIIIVRDLGHTGLSSMVFVKIAIALVILGALIVYLLRKGSINLPFSRLFSGHEDLQPLAAMLFCFGLASLAGLMQLSAAYGAFLGGLIVGNSTERKSIIASAKPIQSVLMMVFFLSVGLLLEFDFIWDNFFKVITLLIFITVGKTGVNILILHLFRQPWSRSFLAGLLLSQVGEFAFVLATIGEDVGVLSQHDKQLIITLAALSLALSPLWLLAARRLHDLGPSVAGARTADQLIHEAYGSEIASMTDSMRKTCGVFTRLWRRKRRDPQAAQETRQLSHDRQSKGQEQGKQEHQDQDKREKKDD